MIRRALAVGTAAGAALVVGGLVAYNALTEAAGCGVSVAAGGSWNAANRAASPGCEVPVAAGSYPTQIIDYVAGRDTAAPVKFVPQGPVQINGDLTIFAAAVYVAGTTSGSMADWRSRSFSIRVSGNVSAEGSFGSAYARNVTIEGVDAGNLTIGSSLNVTVRDTDVGPALLDSVGGRCSRPENRIGANGGLPNEPTNITFERVSIHDQNLTQAGLNAGCHYGGFFVVSGVNLTLRDMAFASNVVYNMQVQNFGGGAIASPVLIESSSFDCPVDATFQDGGNGASTCNGQASIQFSDSKLFPNWTIQSNAFSRAAAAVADPGRTPTFSNVVFRQNTGRKPNTTLCPKAGVSYEQNAWEDGVCGPNDGGTPPPTTTTTTTQPTTTEPPTTTTTTTAPPPPDQPPVFTGNLRIVARTTSTVTIAWDAATDDNGISGYRLYRDGVYLAKAGPLARQARFSLPCGSHLFRVEAVDTTGQGTGHSISVSRAC